MSADWRMVAMNLASDIERIQELLDGPRKGDLVEQIRLILSESHRTEADLSTAEDHLARLAAELTAAQKKLVQRRKQYQDTRNERDQLRRLLHQLYPVTIWREANLTQQQRELFTKAYDWVEHEEGQ